MLWFSSWDLPQIPHASFSSTDISNIIGLPYDRAECNTLKSSPLKTNKLWVSVFGTEKVSKGDLESLWKWRWGEKKSCSCPNPIKRNTYKEKILPDSFLPHRVWIHEVKRVLWWVIWLLPEVVWSWPTWNRQHPTLFCSQFLLWFTLLHSLLVTGPQPHQQIQHSES